MKWQTWGRYDTLQGAKRGLANAERQMGMKAGKNLKIMPVTETVRGKRYTIGYRVKYK